MMPLPSLGEGAAIILTTIDPHLPPSRERAYRQLCLNQLPSAAPRRPFQPGEQNWNWVLPSHAVGTW